MKLKKITSCALALSLTATLALPFAPQAKASSFTDISDPALSENVEVLHALGVLEGNGSGAFLPKDTLSRAQFCKMAVVMQGREGQVGQHQSYTIFPDVRASHWAAGYINLAVRGEEKIISGAPDGSFHPDEKITFAQTVTILMRLLGYQDKDVGAAWPYGYLSAAAANGLTDGLKLRPNDRITRAQAAELFCNLLLTDKKDGGKFAASLGSLQEGLILMSVDATAADGSRHAVKVQDGTVYKVEKNPLDASLAGRRGSLLLSPAGRVLTFVPDKNGSRSTVTVAEAKTSGIVDQSGKLLKVLSSATVYYNGEKTTYGESFFNLRPGTAVTVYYDAAGRIDYLFFGAEAARDAVIIGSDGSREELSQLTDATDYAIFKNGVPADVSDLRAYDVATYDAATNSIRVSDTRLTGYYADAAPNIASPSKITVLGHSFDVLPSAAADLSRFKLGRVITLLLTEDHQVAGAASSEKLSGNAIGIASKVSEHAATVQLFSGLTVEGDPALSKNDVGRYEGQLVSVASYHSGNRISLQLLTRPSVRGTLELSAGKLGDAPLAQGVRLFDKIGKGPLLPVTRRDIPRTTVASGSVLYAHQNYAGQVDIVVLDNVTGDGYAYGRIKAYDRRENPDNPADTLPPSIELLTAENKTVGPFVTYSSGFGAYAGLSTFIDSNGELRLGSIAKTEQLAKVPNSAWNGSSSVTFGGKTYPVSDEVVCYNETTEKIVSLTEARAFADTADLYVDSIGQKVRIVVVRQ